MNLPINDLAQLVLDFTGKAIKSFGSRVLTYDDLAATNDFNNDTEIYIGTLKGSFGEDDLIEMSKKNVTTVYSSYSFKGADEAAGGTNMGIANVEADVIFTCVDALNCPNKQVTFSGYVFIVQ